jgi:hypothetical protein
MRFLTTRWATTLVLYSLDLLFYLYHPVVPNSAGMKYAILHRLFMKIL